MISGSVDNVIFAAALPYLFGMRLLYPGFSKLVSSFNLKRPEGLGRGRCTALVLLLAARRIFLCPSPGCPHLSIQREPADLSGCGLDPVRLLLRPVLAAKQQLMIPQGGFIC